MADYKISKYKQKMTFTNDIDKKSYYLKKIKYYQNMTGGQNLNLLQPRRPTNNDKMINDFFNPDKIMAHGYGMLEYGADLEPVVFERRAPYPNDVVVQILYAGICHSDWHYLVSEWESKIPLVPGHEICGKVVRKGTLADKFQIDDLVLVGSYLSTCQQCSMCLSGREQYCENGMSPAYNGRDRRPGDIEPTGEKTYGGFSNVITVNEDFVFKLPENLPAEVCAPLTDAGVTVFSPLIQYGVKKGHKVGIAGIGGLGHMAVKFAKAMGAEVIELTTTAWKVDDAKRLGADDAVLVSDKAKVDQYQGKLDLIIDTIPKDHDLAFYLDFLKFGGTLWIVGYFDEMKLDVGGLDQHKSIKSSIIGGRPEIEAMLKLCSSHNIVPDVELIKMEDINDTYQNLLDSKVKYRYVIAI